MRILIRYSNATVQAAMLLATIGRRVRAAVPGREDAVEFTWSSQRWLAEDGQAVDIEFDVAGNAAEWRVAYDATAPKDAPADLESQCWPTPEPAESGPAYLN